VRDTRVYLLTCWRLCTLPILPFDYAEAASELGARKAESVLATGAPLLISANPGCSLQIASAVAAQGQDIAVAHTAEVLDASIRGRPL